MMLLAICTLSLASATSAAAQHTPAFYRKQRILRAMSSGERITMRLRGGGELEHSAAATSTAVTKPYRDGSTAPTITMRLRGGGGGGEGGAVPSTAALLNRKERILRAVSSGQAVTEDALLAIEAAAITADRPSPTTWDDPRHNGASPALLRQAASSGLSFAAAAASASARSSSSARVCHRKRRMLQAVSSGHSVTHALERGYVSSC
tara:strand:- start:124 stop:744 length:621 start_codon:yes stop_codon:yes gene_type:complete